MKNGKKGKRDFYCRGVGEIQINKMSNGGFRIIMRNEKTYSLLLNFRIFPKFCYKKKEEKKLIFSYFDEFEKIMNFFIRVNKHLILV